MVRDGGIACGPQTPFFPVARSSAAWLKKMKPVSVIFLRHWLECRTAAAQPEGESHVINDA
jgi:hypothetical protein